MESFLALNRMVALRSRGPQERQRTRVIEREKGYSFVHSTKSVLSTYTSGTGSILEDIAAALMVFAVWWGRLPI